MTENEKRTRPSRRSKRVKAEAEPVLSQLELARLGGGQVAYIKHMSPDEAKRLFPMVPDLPKGIELFALHAADGTPLAITDTIRAAVEHAMGDELEIATVH